LILVRLSEKKSCKAAQARALMSTPAAVTPPTPTNVHLYRAAALAWRNAWRIERQKDGAQYAFSRRYKLAATRPSTDEDWQQATDPDAWVTDIDTARTLYFYRDGASLRERVRLWSPRLAAIVARSCSVSV
jgi:hypothetical protein